MNIREKDSRKTILEVTDDEFTLIQYLLEKNAKKNEVMMEDNLAKDMFKTMSYYELG
jgi:hypothetical protein